jgi:hypothetical protein
MGVIFNAGIHHYHQAVSWELFYKEEITKLKGLQQL